MSKKKIKKSVKVISRERDKIENKVQIQIKNKETSKSLTILNKTVEEVADDIYNLYKNME